MCDTTQRRDHVTRLQQVLARVAGGLVHNASLDLQTLMTFVYHLITGSVLSLKPA